MGLAASISRHSDRPDGREGIVAVTSGKEVGFSDQIGVERLDQLTLAQNYDARGRLQELLKIGADVDNAYPGGGQIPDERKNFPPRVDIDTMRRFIEKKPSYIRSETPRQDRLLLIAAGKRPH
jgi:hypothetical protein